MEHVCYLKLGTETVPYEADVACHNQAAVCLMSQLNNPKESPAFSKDGQISEGSVGHWGSQVATVVTGKGSCAGKAIRPSLRLP